MKDYLHLHLFLVVVVHRLHPPCRRRSQLSTFTSCFLTKNVCVFQEMKQYYEDYQQMKRQQKEEAEAEQEVVISKYVLQAWHQTNVP